MLTRNHFLKTSSLCGIGALISPLPISKSKKNKKLESIGLNLFSAPKILEEDFEGSIKSLSEIGIDQLETYGPYSISDQRNKSSWAALTPMLGFNASGFFGKASHEFKAILNSYGISVPSMHTDLYTLEDNMGALALEANTLGAKYVVLPFIPDHERITIDDYKKVADRFNQIGENAKKEGISFAYHNHGYGLIPGSNGVRPIDLIFDHTDPSYVFFEMDLFWTVAGKANPIDLLVSNSGRYKMLHIKDMKELSYFSGDGSTPDQWKELFPMLVAAGEGVINLDEIIGIAMNNGVEHYIIEHDLAPDPLANISAASNYLRGLRW